MEVPEFRELGRLIYGKKWQTRMAKALGVSVGSVNRWATGRFPIPKPIIVALKAIDKNNKIQELMVDK